MKYFQIKCQNYGFWWPINWQANVYVHIKIMERLYSIRKWSSFRDGNDLKYERSASGKIDEDQFDICLVKQNGPNPEQKISFKVKLDSKLEHPSYQIMISVLNDSESQHETKEYLREKSQIVTLPINFCDLLDDVIDFNIKIDKIQTSSDKNNDVFIWKIDKKQLETGIKSDLVHLKDNFSIYFTIKPEKQNDNTILKVIGYCESKPNSLQVYSFLCNLLINDIKRDEAFIHAFQFGDTNKVKLSFRNFSISSIFSNQEFTDTNIIIKIVAAVGNHSDKDLYRLMNNSSEATPVEYSPLPICFDGGISDSQSNSSHCVSVPYNYNSSYSYNSKKELGYVGLKNQGATCYMNSMLQSLFHTPIFRRIVYQMPTTGSEDPKKSIPLCLQRLFAEMQYNDEPCSTKSLTKSFGWDDYDTFTQHDIQEFNRVLIDNLETKTKNTSLEGEIPSLFRGKFKSFIRCPDINYQKSKIEDFYDLSLVVKDTPNLIESFKKYTQVELLQGDNQYEVEGQGKHDAEMGTSFIEFPSVLHLHLGRFEYDFNYEQLVKIYSKFEFPETIDLSPFIDKDVENTKSNIFDLYGVLVHSGSPSAGHYFAYLRTSTDPQWYQFNDIIVSKATNKEAIEENFGGSSDYSYKTSYYYNSSPKLFSAYMLVYVRREDSNNVFAPVDESAIPQHLKEYLKKKEEKLKESSSKIFNIISDDAITVNSIRKKIGFECKDIQKSISFPKDETITNSMIYQKVSEMYDIDVKKIRLWITWDSKFTPYRIISNNNCAFTGYHNIFLQQKPDDEELEPENDSVIIFMKFFNPQLTSPLQYIGSRAINQKDALSNIFPFVCNIVGISPETPLLAYQETTDLFRILDPKEKIPSDSFSQTLIFQIDPTIQDPPKIFHFKWADEKDIQKFINKDVEERCENKCKCNEELPPEFLDLPSQSYCRMKIGNNIQTANDYFLSIDSTITVIVYNYRFPCEPTIKLEIPKSLLYKDFRDFVVEALNLDYIPERDVLLIYKKQYYNDEPDCFFIRDSLLKSKVENVILNANNLSYCKIYYFLENNSTIENIFSKNFVKVFISNDGYTVSKTVNVLTEKKDTILDLRTSLVEMNLLNQHDDLRISQIDSHKYGSIYKDDDAIFYAYPIRFDSVPLEQKIDDNDKSKMLLSGAHITLEYNRHTAFDNPFYFVLDKNESYESFIERIKDKLKIDDIKRCRIYINDSTDHYVAQEKLLKPGSTIGEQIDKMSFSNTPYIYILHPSKKKSNSHHDEAVRIYN